MNFIATNIQPEVEAESATQLDGWNHVACNFPDVEVRQPCFRIGHLSSSRNFGIPDLPMTCFWKDSSIKILTQGGHEYVVPFNQEVKQVHSIAGGLLIHAVHSLDRIQFTQSRQPQLDRAESFFTLCGHPLNDVQPLGILQREGPRLGLLVASSKRLLFCSDELPLLVFHDASQRKLEFFLLNTRAIDAGEYLASLQPQSRHASLALPSASCDKFLQPLWSITSTSCPELVAASRCVADSGVVIFQAFYRRDAQVAFIRADLRNLEAADSLKAVLVLKDVAEVRPTHLAMPLPSTADTLFLADFGPNPSDTHSLLVNSLERMRNPQQLLVTFSDRTSLVYQGRHKVLNGDLSIDSNTKTKTTMEMLASTVEEMDSDFLVKSALTLLHATLPKQVFVSLWQDIISRAVAVRRQARDRKPVFEAVADVVLWLLSSKASRQSSQRPAESKTKEFKTRKTMVDLTGPRLTSSPGKKTLTLAKGIDRQAENLSSVNQISRVPSQKPLSSSQWLRQVAANQQVWKDSDLDQEELEELFGFQEMKQIEAMLAQQPEQANPFQVAKDDKTPKKTPTISRMSVGAPKQAVVGKPVVKQQKPVSAVGRQTKQPPTKEDADARPDDLSPLTDQSLFLEHAGHLFTQFHYLYEDLKLDKFRFPVQGKQLASFLIEWIMAASSSPSDFLFSEAVELNRFGYLQHYFSDFPCLRRQFQKDLTRLYGAETDLPLNLSRSQVSLEAVPCIQAALTQPQQWPFRVHFVRSFQVLTLINSIRKINNQGGLNFEIPVQTRDQTYYADRSHFLSNVHLRPTQKKDRDLLRLLANIKAGQSDLEIKGHLSIVHLMISLNIDQAVIRLLPDWVSCTVLEVLSQCRALSEYHIGSHEKEYATKFYSLIERNELLPGKHTSEATDFSSPQVGAGQSKANNKATRILGGKIMLPAKMSDDSRFKEVEHMLSASKQMVLNLKHIANWETLPEEKQTEMLTKLQEKYFLRQLSTLVGFGMLKVGSLDTIAPERLTVPKINTQSHLPELGKQLEVALGDDSKKNLMQWPQFHNGAAAALQIVLSLQNQRETDQNFMRNWIMQHRSPTPKPEHAGFLLTLGLFGMLDCLQRTDMYQQLKTIHDLTVIGTLLGRAASKIGTMDPQDTKTLCMHISCLLPATVSVDLALPVQSTAIMGTGLLYKGTRSRQITEFLISQIGRKPFNDKSVEREVYALCTGFALGLTNLGAGSELQSVFGDLNIEERLIRFVEGGPIMDMPKSTIQPHQNQEQACSSIKEGDQVNVHITAAGALHALCFIFLKSNNAQIVKQLTLPDSLFQLDFVRPDFLLQKVLCRNLIMWDSIEPTDEWLSTQMPELISFIFENDIATVQSKYQQQLNGEDLDYACVALCYVNILTGAHLSLGFRFAGSGNQAAFRMIARWAKTLRAMKVVTKMTRDHLLQIYGDQTKNLVDKFTQENCLCVCALAMSLVMAGTGDTECFKMIRVIRKRIEAEMHYGHQMAINMALGLLFLGSGQFKLSTSLFGVASLMCALYPVFPREPNDNRHHLQALRHFWVMAIETQMVQARDVETGELVQAQVILTTKSGETREAETPVIMSEDIVSIEVTQPIYYPIKVQVSNCHLSSQSSTRLEQCIYLKKKQISEIRQETNFKDVHQKQTDPLTTYSFKPPDSLGPEVRAILTPALQTVYLNSMDFIRDKLVGESTDMRLWRHFGGSTHNDGEAQMAFLSRLLLSTSHNRGQFDSCFFEAQDAAEFLGYALSKNQRRQNVLRRVTLAVLISHAKMKDQSNQLAAWLQNYFFKTRPVRGIRLPAVLVDLEPVDRFEVGRDAQLLHESILSLGVRWTSSVSRFSLPPHQLQTLLYLIDHLLSTLKQEGETDLVAQFVQFVTKSKELRCDCESGHALTVLERQNKGEFKEIYLALQLICQEVIPSRYSSDEQLCYVIVYSLLRLSSHRPN